MPWLLMLTLLLPTCSASYKGPTGLSKEEDGSYTNHLPISGGGGSGIGDLLDRQYAALGLAEVVLQCPIPEGVSMVEWQKNGIAGPILKASVREDGKLALWNTSLSQEGEYSCHDPTTGQALHRVHLKLGYPPEKPSVQCLSSSYASAVRCTWKLETETHLDTWFVTTYRHGMDGEERDCVQPGTGTNSCSIADVQLFSIVPYVLNVTAVNPLGTATKLSPFLISQIKHDSLTLRMYLRATLRKSECGAVSAQEVNGMSLGVCVAETSEDECRVQGIDPGDITVDELKYHLTSRYKAAAPEKPSSSEAVELERIRLLQIE
ncbi:uncharacterized protein LOC129329866 [Eublepharis macularius]|uniref:Uncharacterized protein LOC129329866 n=1 Tax=Eublepharis macularius TaxID=481883 RepID=A0AA97JC49_EUBMA|nr:uncharacterized protein LOC129329866 [Eublepharis macularius]